MLTPQPMAGRSAAVRLTEVPLKIRKRAARPLIDRALNNGDLLGAVELQRAVEHPSERVYWLPETAVRRVLG